MTYFYDSVSGGLFIEGYGKPVPTTAIEITKDSYLSIIQGQEEGKIIQPDENGYPVAVVPPPPPAPTEAEKTQQRIAEIEQELTANGLASLHPLRAKVAGTATLEDEAKLAELDEQAKALQAELAALSAPKDMR